ncbi:MAPEG family protein [Ancylobacter sp. SL191]|uniref:MAPEG family protein n=1 Tax=Ancylobacter sp. SL191 TaxID=2995166 RepID=UPI002270B2AE|nr:MAPEG family protein [Ancylobacter sp. SL191]WAC27028.1 MAPEG family protein [Ancylobacter sp. SL191]
MSVQAILLPVFVQVALTFAVLFRLGTVRLRAVRAGRVKRARVLFDESGWPVEVRQVSNAFRNQFEVPVLFYALVAFALITRQADGLFVGLSWIFVLSRIVHAGVHVTSNALSIRFPAYMVGVLVLLLMWVLFALAILFAPAMP